MNNSSSIHLCEDVFFHICSFLDIPSLFQGFYQVNHSYQAITLHCIEQYVKEKSDRYKNWFLNYSTSLFVPYSNLFDEAVLVRERTSNMKVLAKTYDTMIEWMYFMQLIGKVIAPRMLHRVITMHQSKESAQKTNTLVEQQQMSTSKNVDQCSRLLTSIIDVTFVLDHLKMIQFLPMNDMSILRRLEHTFKVEHDSTYRHRFAGAIDTNVNLIKTEFCCSFSMMFSGVKNKDNFYEFVLSYVKDVLPLQYGTGQPTRDRNTFASK